MPQPDPAPTAEIVAELTARLAAAEGALAAREKTVQALIHREKERAAKHRSTFDSMEENSTLQQVVARKTLELEAQNWKLEQSEERFSTAFEHAPIGVALVSPEGRWLKVNRALCEVLGYSEAELLTRTFQDITHPEDLAADMVQVHRVLAGEIRSYQIEKRYLHGRGHIVTVLLDVSLVRDEQGRPLHFISQIQDITARKQAEEKLRKSEESIRLVMESIAEGFYAVDPQGNCTLVNRAFLQMTGYDREEDVLGQHIHELIHHTRPDGSPYPAKECRMYEALQNQTGTHVDDEVFWRRDGTSFPVEYWSYPIFRDGQLIGVAATFFDITERKRAEQALQESEEKLREVFEHASQVFYSHDVDGQLTYVSPQAQDFFDCPSTEALRSWTDFLTDNPGNAEGILLTRRAIESGETQRPYQLELRSRQGRILWVEVHESPMVVQGRTVAIVGALTDITARKQAEAKQRAEEERFLHQRDALIAFTNGAKDNENLTATIRRLMETDAKTMGVARVSVWRYNSDRTAIRCLDLYELAEDRHSSGTELPAAAYPGYFRALEGLDVIAAEDAHRDPRTCEFSESYLRPLGITSMLDAPIHVGTAGAGVLCHEHIGPPRRWTADEETFAVAVANRVSLALEGSERQQAEEELRSAHAQLEQMVTYSPALIYRLKVEGDSFVPVAVSANVTALLGYAVAEVLNREWWPAQLHPEDRERVLASSSETAGPGSSRAEYRVRHKAGGYRWIEDHRRVLCDAAGQPLEIIGVWMDITERKEAEESLRLLSSAVEQSRESILVTDAELDQPGPRIVFANPAYLQMTGYTIEEIIGKTPRMMQGPRSNRAALRRLRHNLERGEAFSGETVNYRKDGTEYDQEWQVAPIRNAAGTITHFVSIQHDITERKRAEQALQASQEHMRLQTAALESAANGVVITDATGTIQWVNQAFTRLTGYSPEEAIGQNPRVLKSGRHPEAYYNGMWQTLSAGRVWRGEIVNRRKDGELYHEAMTITPIRDAGGVTTHYIAIKQDISERKRNEASIQEMHKQLLDASRQAGMAEIATNVLHNVGNVLNSVNVSVSVATEKARGLKVATLERLATMLGGQPDLGAFFASDPRGAEVPAFLTRIAGRLETDRAAVLGELDALRQHIDHINEIVAMQQNYARVCGVTEVLPLVDLIEDALRLNAGSIERHGLEVIRDFAEVPPIPVERHKVLQILVNLIRNAKHALDDGAPAEKRLTLRLARSDDGHAQIVVSDNGVGIPPENMTRIFEHGFTTRKDGHGFGLHSSANAAHEMGGSLTAQSDGPGRGATFTLDLPLPSSPAQL